MEDLTSKLRRLATRRPSTELDGRVLDALASSFPPEPGRGRRVGLGWAVAVALLMGVLGYWAGRSQGASDGQRSERLEPPFDSKNVQVLVDTGQAGNPFDFSQRRDELFDVTWETEIRLIVHTLK